MKKDVPEDLKDILSTIRATGELPDTPEIVKYEFRSDLSKVVGIFFLGIVVLIGASLYFGDFGSRYFVIMLALLFTFLMIGGFSWWRNKKGRNFVLLTPRYLVSVMGPVEYYEWESMEQLCIESDARVNGKEFKLRGWPIDESLSKMTSTFHLNEQIALKAGNPRISFLYNGKTNFINIPGKNLQNAIDFINKYWTTVSPGAKRKGVVYL